MSVINYFCFYRWADEIKSVGRDGGEPKDFYHPIFQASVMFLGELSCLLVFKILYRVFSKRAVSISIKFVYLSITFREFC